MNGWPSDLYRSGFSTDKLDILDVTSFVAPLRRMNTDPGDADFDARWDLAETTAIASTVNIQDVLALVAGETGNPPMFGGQQAFGRSCVP